ncbi:MAG: hypothetical protein Q8W51_09730 [Candidatus Palauibacterales bacterium]|nr:hypothetical protein [Candidatus Palauibacterales bacterium]MDP2530009.1 hypothetical protein [Candidatus Palauibacterales bacterium]MDP2585024.1 hypothetical protein [Candidatus Palauibacterales bacterium]
MAERLGAPLPVITGDGKPLIDAIIESGYIFATIRVAYVLAVLHPARIPRALIWFALSLLVLYANRAAYRPVLRPVPLESGTPATSEP